MLAQTLAERLQAGDRQALAHAATLIENRTPVGREIVRAIFPNTGDALVVGITGPPGAGKSTLVNALTAELRKNNHRVGILAVDPSSSFSGGAVLGDRVRMQQHHADADVFVRSMASRGKLGGIAAATAEASLLLDAAGFDVILIETVGVGQDEIDIAGLADVTVVVLVPGLGDDVQAIKAGLLEIADVFAVNKSDLPGADRLAQEIRTAQSFALSRGGSDTAPVCKIVASEGRGIAELWTAIGKARRTPRTRHQTWTARLREMLEEELLLRISQQSLDEHAARVASHSEDPYQAVAALLKELGLRGF